MVVQALVRLAFADLGGLGLDVDITAIVKHFEATHVYYTLDAKLAMGAC